MSCVCCSAATGRSEASWDAAQGREQRTTMRVGRGWQGPAGAHVDINLLLPPLPPNTMRPPARPPANTSTSSGTPRASMSATPLACAARAAASRLTAGPPPAWVGLPGVPAAASTLGAINASNRSSRCCLQTPGGGGGQADGGEKPQQRVVDMRSVSGCNVKPTQLIVMSRASTRNVGHCSPSVHTSASGWPWHPSAPAGEGCPPLGQSPLHP